jgi:hypothetical protein
MATKKSKLMGRMEAARKGWRSRKKMLAKAPKAKDRPPRVGKGAAADGPRSEKATG